MPTPVEALLEHLRPFMDLQRAGAVLAWDQEVNMPPQGARARGEQLATLAQLAHDHFTSAETGNLLDRAERETRSFPFESDEASHVRIARREFDRATRLPSEFVAEFTRAVSAAFQAWNEARQTNRYSRFAPHLETMIDLNRRKASYLMPSADPCDALLDPFEPGMRCNDLDPIFASLATELKERIPLIMQRQRQAAFPPGSVFADDRQWAITLSVLRTMGYDFEAGRQDRSPHPFTTSFSTQDVRVTTRLQSDNPLAAIYGSMHEGGHALYEQGIPEHLDRTLLAEGASLGVHESQSRLWENHVGRSRAFLAHLHPLIVEQFGSDVGTLDDFTAICRNVQPGLIRVEADEVTYNLHILIRYHIERELISGRLSVLPARDAWNALYREYLGIEPDTDANGILQDVHWAHGAFGYFPTYTLGNLMAAMLYDRASAEIPGLADGLRRGECLPLLQWLRLRVHRHGARFEMRELLKRELGSTLSIDPFLRHIDRRYMKSS